MDWRLLLLTVLTLACAAAQPFLEGVFNDTEDQTTAWDPHSVPPGLDFQIFPGKDTENSVTIGKRQINNAAALSYLMFANRRFLVQMNTSGSVLTVFRLGDEANSISLDFDYRQRYVFWTDVAKKIIYSARPDGTNVQLLVNTRVTVPDGVAWDWVNYKLYWTDAEDKDIEVLDPVRSGSYRRVLIQTGPTSIPRAIVLNPRTRIMYWTDWGTPGKIESASMDGTNRRVLHNTNLGWPNGLTLDYPTQILYWVDASLDRIESSNTDGSNRRLLSTISIFHPFGITIYRGRLYWTDWQLNAILTAPTSQLADVTAVFQNLTFDPMQIHFVSEERQPLATNPCGGNYGGCSHLCLLSSLTRLGYTCGCPEGMVLIADQRTCTTGTGPSPSSGICFPPCRNGGQCISGQCFCPNGFSGTSCQDAVCNPRCQNGGTCVNGFCICSSDWTGPQCAQARCNPMCLYGGTCSSGRCFCPPGRQGLYCQEEVCIPACLNGGQCRNGRCVCPSTHEDTVCSTEVCNPPCRNGKCVSGQCQCSRGWEGDQCEKAVCFPPSGCLNGGFCGSPGICSCPYKWIGERCDEAECVLDCVHGDCVAPDTCSCHHGWRGAACNEAICFPPDGCLHEGHCVAPGTCSCPQQWRGERCENAICVPMCIHGDCIIPGYCYCHDGYRGPTCSEAMCFPPCLNGGTCARPGTCVCPIEFVGARCELKLDD